VVCNLRLGLGLAAKVRPRHIHGGGAGMASRILFFPNAVWRALVLSSMAGTGGAGAARGGATGAGGGGAAAGVGFHAT
jgi:hypothetical protein